MKILLTEDEAELPASISEALIRQRFIVEWKSNLLQVPWSPAYRKVRV
jgi:DNA-binding response OmpR family regulator